MLLVGVRVVGVLEEVGELGKRVEEIGIGFARRGLGEGLEEFERALLGEGRRVGGMGLPDLDEALEGVVWGEVLGLEGLHRGRTRVVAVVEPGLDAGSVVGHARAEADRGFHHV